MWIASWLVRWPAHFWNVTTRDQINARRREWRKRPEVREKELVRRREMYWQNVSHNRSLLRATRARHLQDRRRRSLEWYYANKDKARENHKEWIRNNQDKIKLYNKNKMSRCLAYRISRTTKHRMWYVANRNEIKLSRGRKSELLGCDRAFLIKWLEKQFKPGMSWENYGVFGWHIDHIRPCASFDLSDPKQQSECFHYTNLQPLWWKDNLSKHSKWKEAVWTTKPTSTISSLR